MGGTRIGSIEVQPIHGASYLWGAHHPHCDRHRNHLIWICRHPLCLGCTCLYTGATVGSVGTLFLDWDAFGFAMWAAIHFFLVLPTAAQPWCQRKVYKIVARFFLGLAAGSYLVSGFFAVKFGPSRPAWALAVVFAFAAVMHLLVTLRRLKPSDPCSKCPLGMYPTCEWNRERLLAENSEPVLVAALESYGNSLAEAHREQKEIKMI